MALPRGQRGAPFYAGWSCFHAETSYWNLSRFGFSLIVTALSMSRYLNWLLPNLKPLQAVG